MKKKLLNILSLASISLLIMGNVQAQKWTIDPELKDAQLKVAFNDANIEAGESIYQKFCSGCHKDVVAAPKNDRAAGSPPNLGNQEFQKGNTDGEIFCKLSHGNGVGMPAYEASISEDDRWKIVAFLRSYCETYVPPTADNADAAPAEEKFDGTITNMALSFDKETQIITAKVEGKDADGNNVTPKNVKISIYVKRYFGDLPLCDKERTDDKGIVSVELGNVPTDTSGYIDFIANINKSEITAEAHILVDEGWTWVNPLDSRHLWGTRDKTPIWLLVLYFGSTLFVLGVIAWSVLQLFRIWNLRER